MTTSKRRLKKVKENSEVVVLSDIDNPAGWAEMIFKGVGHMICAATNEPIKAGINCTEVLIKLSEELK